MWTCISVSFAEKTRTVPSPVTCSCPHNYCDPQTGQPKAKVLYTFGREDEMDLEALRRLDQSIHRFVGDEFASGRGSRKASKQHCWISAPWEERICWNITRLDSDITDKGLLGYPSSLHRVF